MSSFYMCPTCNKYIWKEASRPHKCKPAWDVWDPENEDREDTSPVYELTAEYAVETWAEQDDCDSADYSIVGGTPATVYVVPHDAPEDAKPQRFVVSGETVPQYSAEEIIDTKNEV